MRSRDEQAPRALDLPGAALGTVSLAAVTVALVTAGSTASPIRW